MSYKIEEIEGIGPVYAEKLRGQNIQTTDDLLARAGSADGRKELAASADVGEKLILEWANLADLMRVNGVGEEYADLLEEAGVDTVKELAGRVPENLAAKMAEVSAAKNLTNAVPSATVVAKWVEEAKGMDPMISH